MDYLKVIFVIESDYDKVKGWINKEDENRYYRELEALLKSVGWSVKSSGEKNPYPIAIKNKERLKLAPTCLCGVIALDTPKKIGKLLSRAKFFKYRRIEVLEKVSDKVLNEIECVCTI